MRPSLAFALVLATVACGGPDLESGDLGADGLMEEGLASPGTWFEARRDLRRCAAPPCGGWFVHAIGKRTTTCVVGSAASECYAAAMDLAGAGVELPASAAAEVVVRGRLVRGRIAGQSV